MMYTLICFRVEHELNFDETSIACSLYSSDLNNPAPLRLSIFFLCFLLYYDDIQP